MSQEAPSAVPETLTSEPSAEQTNVRLPDTALQGDALTIIILYKLQRRSEDIRNCIAALLFIVGVLAIVFGPQTNYVGAILGFVLLVIACGIFRLRYIAAKGFGLSLAVGQSEPTPAASTGWGAKIFWALLGVVIGGGALYALIGFQIIPLIGFQIIPIPAL